VISDALPVGDRLATGGPDLVSHLLSHTHVATASVELDTRIVHHDLGTFLRQQHGLGPADAPAGSCDDRHPSIQQSH
jgi:hypothetical protein